MNMRMQCVFCQIIAGDIPATTEYEDDQVIVIKDLHPKAPVHLLVIPKRHLVSLAESTTQDQDLLGHLLFVVSQVATKQGLNGYKTVINTGHDGGQVINHLHLHLLGGKKFEEN